VAMVVESPEEGRLLKILRAENETVPVGEAIAWIGESEQAQP